MEQTHKRNEIAIAFGGTFAFFQTHKAKQKNPKEPPSKRTNTP